MALMDERDWRIGRRNQRLIAGAACLLRKTSDFCEDPKFLRRNLERPIGGAACLVEKNK
jgi:hypothetical protein